MPAGVEIRESQSPTVHEQPDPFAVAVGRGPQELVERLIRVDQADPSPRGHGAPVMRVVRAWAVSDGSARSIGPGSASVNIATVTSLDRPLSATSGPPPGRPADRVRARMTRWWSGSENGAMDFSLSPTEAEFRSQLVQWLATVDRPAGLRDYGMTPTEADLDSAIEWHRLLYDAGYAGLSWPVEHGGRNASTIEQAIFAEETALSGVPRNRGTVGIDLAGPAVMRFGSAAQQERLLGPTLRGELAWTQLFSEPDAGSDLAGLRTRADAHGGGWVANGQKVWNTGASFAHLGLLLARTDRDQPRHRGITMFIVPMDRPGIDVRPLRQMDEESKFSEVHLNDVELTPEDVLGRPNEGWAIAGDVLGRERSGIGAHAVTLLRALEVLRDEALSRGIAGHPVFRQRWAAAWSGVRLLRISWLRELTPRPAPTTPCARC